MSATAAAEGHPLRAALLLLGLVALCLPACLLFAARSSVGLLAAGLSALAVQVAILLAPGHAATLPAAWARTLVSCGAALLAGGLWLGAAWGMRLARRGGHLQGRSAFRLTRADKEIGTTPAPPPSRRPDHLLSLPWVLAALGAAFPLLYRSYAEVSSPGVPTGLGAYASVLTAFVLLIIAAASTGRSSLGARAGGVAIIVLVLPALADSHSCLVPPTGPARAPRPRARGDHRRRADAPDVGVGRPYGPPSGPLPRSSPTCARDRPAFRGGRAATTVSTHKEELVSTDHPRGQDDTPTPTTPLAAVAPQHDGGPAGSGTAAPQTPGGSDGAAERGAQAGSAPMSSTPAEARGGDASARGAQDAENPVKGRHPVAGTAASPRPPAADDAVTASTGADAGHGAAGDVVAPSTHGWSADHGHAASRHLPHEELGIAQPLAKSDALLDRNRRGRGQPPYALRMPEARAAAPLARGTSPHQAPSVPETPSVPQAADVPEVPSLPEPSTVPQAPEVPQTPTLEDTSREAPAAPDS